MNTDLFRSIVVMLAAIPAAAAPRAAEVRSPDGAILVTVGVDAAGQPGYSVRFRGSEVVGESKLGLRFAREPAFDVGFAIAGVWSTGIDTQWEQPWGERRVVRDRCTEALVTFESVGPRKRRYALRVRVYDDGLGFRYEVPVQDGYADIDVVDELTEFRLPAAATAWWMPGRGADRYEYLYRETPLGDVQLAHTPMTVRLPGGVHLSIHEAALVDYAAYVLQQRRPGVFRTDLTPWSDGIRVHARTPLVTPWRSIQVSPDAVGLINSDLILNLNEPNALGDVGWVRPGKYVGIWWAIHTGQKTWAPGPDHGATTAAAKRTIDFAAANGFSGVLVEGWNVGWAGEPFDLTAPYPDFDLAEVAAYARQHGVGLIGHHETWGDVSRYEQQLGAALDLYASLGVHVVKSGYVTDGGTLRRVDGNGVVHYEWHDGQYGVRHFLDAVRQAAERHIAIDTHEPVKDTGLRRTYPNWLTREGARGQEYDVWGSPGNPPEHTVILPFTRLLAGPLDYTPGIFDLTFDGPAAERRVRTTLARQLAHFVILYSPLQMAADLPGNYAARPDAFQFIRDVPADWDESIALAGEVGDYVVIARRVRGGDDWYLGAATDDRARRVAVRLDFLEPGRQYLARLYRDADDADWRSNPYAMTIETREIQRGATLDLPLAAGGGAAIRFEALGTGEN